MPEMGGGVGVLSTVRVQVIDGRTKYRHKTGPQSPPQPAPAKPQTPPIAPNAQVPLAPEYFPHRLAIAGAPFPFKPWSQGGGSRFEVEGRVQNFCRPKWPHTATCSVLNASWGGPEAGTMS
jgi:hypothetical protein